MKKIATLILALIALTSCENVLTKNLGGTMTIVVEKGHKVTNATWKDNELWYFIEPMEEGYIPKTKTFEEKSTYGVAEGKVIFKEYR